MVQLSTETKPLGGNVSVQVIADADRYRLEHPDARVATCGQCGRSWDDSIATDWTPAPSGRCPFEYEHSNDPADSPAFRRAARGRRRAERGQLTGAGLFDLRSLSTETLALLHDEIGWRTGAASPKETALASMIRRILLERGAL